MNGQCISSLPAVILVVVGSFALGACGGEDESEPTESASGDLAPAYCNVPDTTSQTVSTSRAGVVELCSAAWVEATGSAACVSETECTDQGKRCLKEPGHLAVQCLTPCGNGLVCPEGEYCRDCEDSEPHCAKSSSCPTPKVKRYDEAGNECSEARSTVDPPDEARVTQACAPYSASCSIDCFSSADCCNDSRGLPQFCERYDIGGDYALYQTCEAICTTASDCGDPDKYCCAAANSKDSTVSFAMTVEGEPATMKICFSRGVYDFCPAVGGTTSPGGGSSGGGMSYSECVQTCVEAGGTNCGDTCR